MKWRIELTLMELIQDFQVPKFTVIYIAIVIWNKRKAELENKKHKRNTKIDNSGLPFLLKPILKLQVPACIPSCLSDCRKRLQM